MSVFESIKGTFHSAKQDIVDGLRSLTSLDSQPRPDMLRRLRTDGVNLDAGADLLNKYQQTWKELQEYTAQSAKNAEEVDGEIGRLYVRWDHQADLVSRLEEEVAELPAVVTLIKKLTNDLAYIKEDCRVVEGALERLENVCEEIDQQKNMNAHRAQLASYKQKKAEEVQKVKVQMAKRHAQAMQECDKRRQTDLKERQEAFNDAFSQDMDYYKVHGNMDQLKVSDIPIPKVSSLSDITIDDDQKVINDFLASTDTTPSRERSTDDLGDTSEGGFFEDDYTADYNIQSDEDLLDDEIDEMSHEPPGGLEPDLDQGDIDIDESGDERREETEETMQKTEETDKKSEETEVKTEKEVKTEVAEEKTEETEQKTEETNKETEETDGKTEEKQTEVESSKEGDDQGGDNSVS